MCTHQICLEFRRQSRIVAPGFGGRGGKQPAGVSSTAHRNPARVVVPSHVPHHVPWRPLLPLPVPTNSLPSFCLLLFVVGIVFSLSFVVFLLSIITHATDFCYACCDDVRKRKKAACCSKFNDFTTRSKLLSSFVNPGGCPYSKT